jgi:GNAT superfamily N-acetyltransferase
VIRVADRDDLARLEQIEKEADALLIDYLHAEVWPAIASLHERMGHVGYVLALVEQENADAIGFAHVLLIEEHAHLEQLSVLPSHARRGHGRSLVVAAKREAAALGCGSMTLRTFADVPWNGPFYERCGFVETAPLTQFERGLVRVEEGVGLTGLGRRVQMTCQLV